MSQPGFGVMIGMLGGNDETVKAVKSSIGQEVIGVKLADDVLHLWLGNGRKLSLRDAGQSCCERRYMEQKDDVDIIGGKLTSVELAECPTVTGEHGDETECQFLRVHTDKGVVTFANYNEHNGYYGGFWIEARLDGDSD